MDVVFKLAVQRLTYFTAQPFFKPNCLKYCSTVSVKYDNTKGGGGLLNQ